MKLVMGILCVGLLTGCATGPKTALRSSNLKAGHVVYFEQSDRVPKDVLLAAFNDKGPVVNALAGIPPDVAAKAIAEILKVIPDLSKNYSKERMHNALIGRRMLFLGYESPEQLEKVNAIVKSMGGAIEYVTPQEDKKPAQ